MGHNGKVAVNCVYGRRVCVGNASMLCRAWTGAVLFLSLWTVVSDAVSVIICPVLPHAKPPFNSRGCAVWRTRCAVLHAEPGAKRRLSLLKDCGVISTRRTIDSHGQIYSDSRALTSGAMHFSSEESTARPTSRQKEYPAAEFTLEQRNSSVQFGCTLRVLDRPGARSRLKRLWFSRKFRRGWQPRRRAVLRESCKQGKPRASPQRTLGIIIADSAPQHLCQPRCTRVYVRKAVKRVATLAWC